MSKYPSLTLLAFLGFQLNGHTDAPGASSFTLDDLYDGLHSKTLWKVLASKVPGTDVSIFTDPDLGKTNGPTMLQAIQDAAEGMQGREMRKYGVDDGMRVLLAYVLEAIQSNYWTSK